MTHVLITGAAGMIGRKLIERLAKDGAINGRKIERLTLTDVVQPAAPNNFSGKVDAWVSDLAAPGEAERAVAGRPDFIFHLAGVVSGEAELDLEKGYRVNLDGTRALLEAIRKTGDGYCPKFVFTSSIAVFGAPFPDRIYDEFFLTPLTSYGTQKAMSELMLADFSRRGILEGIREPLAGDMAVLPVEESVRHTHASPRAAIGFLLHAAKLTREQLGPRINLNMPGVSVTVGEQLAALKRVAGDKVAARIKREPDPLVIRIVAGWSETFDPKRAVALGFRAENNFDEIIRIHIDDELGGKFAA
jgi:D-erythronate 2-dehydrogenase